MQESKQAAASTAEDCFKVDPSYPGYHLMPTAPAPPSQLSAADVAVITGMQAMGYQVCNKRTRVPCDTLSAALLGGGSFGRTYCAVHTLERDHYAVKVVDIEQVVAFHETSVDKIIEEVLVLKKLQHRNVVRYYPANMSADRRYLFIPMELCVGSLLDVLGQGPAPADTLRRYLSELAAGFLYLHEEKKVVHRDVKADNILLGQDGGVRVADVGLARHAGETEEESMSILSSKSFRTLKEQRGHVV